MKNRSFEDRYDIWYDANKEALTQQTEEGRIKTAFEAGFWDADSMVPSALTWALGMYPDKELVLLENDGKYAAGIGELFIQGPTALGCLAVLAATLLKDEKPKIITPGE